MQGQSAQNNNRPRALLESMKSTIICVFIMLYCTFLSQTRALGFTVEGMMRVGGTRSLMTTHFSSLCHSRKTTRHRVNWSTSKLHLSGSPEISDHSRAESKTNSVQDRPLFPPGALRLKVRQHVNPLSSTYQRPLSLPNTWIQDAYPNSNLPMVLDIGCAKGSWVLDMAAQHTHINFLGLEIRRPVVNLCLRRKQHRQLTNVHFLPSNANVDLENLLQSLHSHHVSIQCVCIQFPDPHFKVKHRKRRVVNKSLVNLLARQLPAGCKVFFQTDIEELAYDMWGHFATLPQYFRVGEGGGEGNNSVHSSMDKRQWDSSQLDKNMSIFPVRTEREVATLHKGGEVFRMCMVRSHLPYAT
ncbi:tRNA (guanosine(46)-N7)-methyltransferase TrmB [archaeon]|nr:MAG: tRNA (guanosine(46)-N7)-methyltransferase TrmB [archaeon]